MKLIKTVLIIFLLLSINYLAGCGSGGGGAADPGDGGGGQEPSWHIETVTDKIYMYYTSIALDATDKPHISFCYNVYDLGYAKWNGTGWDVIAVETVNESGLYNSIAVDSSGYPHICHYYRANYDNPSGSYLVNELRYVKWNGTSFDPAATVDNIGKVGKFTSLALDGSNKPHIAYYDETNGNLKYATLGGAWTTDTVDTDVADVGEDASLALDSSGKPHIAYFDKTNNQIKYAGYNGAAWDKRNVANVAAVDLAIAVGSDGYPRIVYNTSSSLKLATWNGSAWTEQQIDTGTWLGEVSLALDGSNRPHVCYYDGYNESLKYAKWDGSAWKKYVVDSAGDVGSYNSIALDSAGRPHFSYRDFDNNSLKYARLQ